MKYLDRQAAHAVTVTLPEIDQLIRRAFRATKPRVEKSSWGEVIYILTPDAEDPTNVIQVQTSVFTGQAARGEGEDSMRVTLMNTKSKRPFAGREQRVHRVENWRDNLRKRIEDAIEKFEDLTKEREEARAKGTVREEQERFRQERPQEAKSEHDRQVAMLQALAVSRSRNSGIFADMLQRMRGPNALLSPKQLAWAEKEYAIFAR